MGRKNTKRIKHALKTKIDFADSFIKLAAMGDTLLEKYPEEHENTGHTRETITEQLTKCRKDILELTDKYIAEIDTAIEKMK